MSSIGTRQMLLLPAVALLALAGCKSTKNRCDTCPPPPPPGGAFITPGQPGPPPGGTTLLPPAPPPPGAPQVSAPPPSFPPVASFYPAPGVRLSPPAAAAPAQALAPTSPTIRLLPPQFGASSPEPKVAETPAPPAATPALPVGIVDFAPALTDRVAAGRKPALEGLDWLKANGYKSALQLRRPGESDAADRKQVETRGLTFTSLEVSPATLSWQTVDAFAKLVSDPSTQPLFVYDADGSLCGGLWYLYFRKVERLPDESARMRALRLGLKEGADGPHRDMWLAVQRLLAAGV